MTVRELLDNKSKWLQGRDACDSEGKTVHYYDKRAVKWCIIGALLKCYGVGEEKQEAERKLWASAETMYGVKEIVTWQDEPSTTFAMVRAVILLADV